MKRFYIPLIPPFMLVALFISATAELRSQNQSNSSQQSQPTFDEDRGIPLTDYDTPEIADANKRARRQAKGKKYDKSEVIGPNTTSGLIVKGDAVDTSLPAFPVTQSSVVVIGEITDAQAYLSNDKTGIYSEFSVRIEKVFKNESGEPITDGSIVEAEREGGRVRYPSGHIVPYIIERQRMPRIGGRYLLFLRRNNREEEFYLLMGYELREGKVSPLDNLPQPKKYEGVAETTFLDKLQTILFKF